MGEYLETLQRDTHQRLPFATMTALSMEKASLGRPAMFQAWILMGSPRVAVRE